MDKIEGGGTLQNLTLVRNDPCQAVACVISNHVLLDIDILFCFSHVEKQPRPDTNSAVLQLPREVPTTSSHSQQSTI